MTSYDATINKEGRVVRKWNITQMKTYKDACDICVDDTLICKEMTFTVTWINEKKDQSEYLVGCVFVGAVNGENKWNFVPGRVICWGPSGISDTYALYKQQRYLFGKQVYYDEYD